MNKIIRTVRISTPEDIRESIKLILDRLEKYNYVHIKRDDNIPACRLFARFTREYKPVILVTPGDRKHIKTIISLDPAYEIERINEFDFKLKRR